MIAHIKHIVKYIFIIIQNGILKNGILENDLFLFGDFFKEQFLSPICPTIHHHTHIAVCYLVILGYCLVSYVIFYI